MFKNGIKLEVGDTFNVAKPAVLPYGFLPMKNITELINAKLETIEQQEGVIVLLAVESGSRAWGFPSSDSDYDVRFIYCRPPDWYLSIDMNEQSDVIEFPIENAIDLCGWDIRKALGLFRKSNPPLLEWLQCPIVYMERTGFAARLRDFLPDFYSPKASFFHYQHMAEGNYRDYLRGAIVWQKKYFYVLRPLLATKWIRQGHGPVPIEFNRLVESTIPAGPLRETIDRLIEAKMEGAELDRGPRIEIISAFIEDEIKSFQNDIPGGPMAVPATGKLNELFRSTLNELWPSWFCYKS